MATIKTRCNSCGAEIDATVGQGLGSPGVTWHMSYACPNCWDLLEADGGTTPVDVRAAILAEDGTWALEVGPEGAATRMLGDGTYKEMELRRRILAHA